MVKKRKKFISMLLMLVLVISMLQPIGVIEVEAYTTQDDYFRYEFITNYNTSPFKKEVRITEFSYAIGSNEDIIVPEEIDGCKVTEIGNGTPLENFNLYDNFKSVVLPDTIRKIGNKAFYQFKGDVIELSESLEEIGNEAFGLSKISHIDISDNVTIIGDNAFYNCNNLTEVNISENSKLKDIGSYAFYGSKIKKIMLPKSIKIIRDQAFRLSGLEGDLSFEGYTTTFGKWAFSNTNIKSVILPNTVTLSESVFSNCRNLEYVKLDAKEPRVPTGTFVSCDNLERVELSTNVNELGASCFGYCSKLDNGGIDISKITTFGDACLKGTNFSGELLLNNITKVDGDPFGATKIKKLIMNCTKSTIGQSFGVRDSSELEELVINGFKGKLQGSTYLPSLKSVYLDVAQLGTNCFDKGTNSLTDIVITNSVGSIDKDAFKITNGSVKTNLYTDNSHALSFDWMKNGRNVTINGLTSYDREPSANNQSKTYRKANPSNISFTIDLGRGGKSATAISNVIIDYTELNASNYEFAGNALTIKKEFLEGLDKGSYDIGIIFNDVNGTSVSGLLSILVVGSDSGNNGGTDNEPPVALETLSYQFYKDYQRDIMIPIQMNNAKILEGLYLGTDLIDVSKYSFVNDTIVIGKTYLSTIDAGVYRIMPVFDGGIKINNLLIEVFDKYDDRLLPYLVPSHIQFDNQDLRLKVELGEGKTKATNVKLLLIDDMYVLPNGEAYGTNPLESIEMVSGSAINAEGNILLQRFKLGNKFAPNMVIAEKPYYYLDGDELVLNAKLIKKLNLMEGSVHSIGCIFNNSEETASLNRVKLVIPSNDSSYSENDDLSGSGSENEDNNSGNNSSSGGNSNSGSGSDNSSGGSFNSGDGNSSNSDNDSSSNGGSNNIDSSNSENTPEKDNNHNNSENNSSPDKIIAVTETIALNDIIYNGKRDVVIILAGKETVKKVKLNSKSLKKSEYQVKGNKVVLFQNTLNKLKDGTNGVSILTKSGTSYITYIKYDFSKQESKIPFMITYKLLLKGSKFPVHLGNQKVLKEVKWTSSNSKIVSVDKKGILVAKKRGKVTVTCKARNRRGDLYKFQIKVTVKDGKKTSFFTQVKDKPYSSAFPVFIMDKLVYKGKTVHIKVSNLAKDSKISYKSSNPSVATVDNKGNIKGKKKGTTIVTVTLKQNNETYIYKLQCKCK